MLLMCLAGFLQRLLGRDDAPSGGHQSEFSRPMKDATPEEAEQRSEHLRRDRERREEGKRP